MSESPLLERAKHTNVLALAVPQVILFGGMLVMLVVHPNAVRSGLMSTRAILVNAGLLAGWLLLSFVLLPRVLRNDYLRAAGIDRSRSGSGIRARRPNPPRQQGGRGLPDARVGAAPCSRGTIGLAGRAAPTVDDCRAADAGVDRRAARDRP